MSKCRVDAENYSKYSAAANKHGYDDYEVLSKETNLTVEQIKDLEKLNGNYLCLSYSKLDNGNTLEEIIADDYNLEEEILLKFKVKDVLDNLTKEQRLLVELRYIQNKTQKEIADMLGISQVQVSRKLSKITPRKEKNVRNLSGVQKAYEMFDSGCSNSNVSSSLGLSPDSTRTYRARWRKEVENGRRKAI